MNRWMNQAVREAKLFVVPAAIVAGWLMIFGGVIATMNRPSVLPASIEKVLSRASSADPQTPVAVAQLESTVRR